MSHLFQRNHRLQHQAFFFFLLKQFSTKQIVCIFKTDAAVDLLKFSFSMLWAPQTNFHSNPLCLSLCRERGRNLRDGYFKTWAALGGPRPRMQNLQIHEPLPCFDSCSIFPSNIYIFKSHTIFFIKTSSSSMFCAPSVPFWPTGAYCYMNYLFDCLCRRNIYSNEEPGNRIYCSICPPMTLLEVMMMMTVINWSWWPTTDKTCMRFVSLTGPPRLASYAISSLSIRPFLCDFCDEKLQQIASNAFNADFRLLLLSAVPSWMFSKYLGGIFMGISPSLRCCVRPVTLYLLQRHHSSSTLSSQHMFHLPRINLTQLHIILSCLVPWDTTTEKHVLLAKMCCGCGAKWELIAAIKILYHLQMVSVFQNAVLQYTLSPM